MINSNFLLNLIPPKFRFLLVNIKNKLWGGYKKYYFSQNGEDVFLLSIFKDLKISQGFYVDIGAHHPKRYSNTYLLYKQGWHGINVDPNPYTIKLFNAARKQDVNLNVGIADKKGTLEYFSFSDPAINTFSVQAAKKYQNKNGFHF